MDEAAWAPFRAIKALLKYKKGTLLLLCDIELTYWMFK